jgi:hypothetical protein
VAAILVDENRGRRKLPAGKSCIQVLAMTIRTASVGGLTAHIKGIYTCIKNAA